MQCFKQVLEWGCMSVFDMVKLHSKFSWKKYHRWFGLVLSVFMLVFCVSGIILNHRQFFSWAEVNRSWLPSTYHIQNFNNGVIKGTLATASSDSVLVYGSVGVWITDRDMSVWHDFNEGLSKSIDERNIRHVVRSKDGTLWCAALRDVYRYDKGSKGWKRVELPGNEERIMDVALGKDSMKVLALTRSKVYEIFISDAHGLAGKSSRTKFHVSESRVIPSPWNFEPKTTLFKIVWHLHSGEFFGLPGKLVVDAIALVLILLSFTGIVLFILPYRMRKLKRLQLKEKMRLVGKHFACHMKWHDRIGYATIVLTLWVAITGMCLRPPLMVPLVLGKVSQSVGEDGNVWQDKLRAIRWDEEHDGWLVSTSDGFLNVDEDFHAKSILWPQEKGPKVSPMGVTVLEPDGKGGWIVGSFRGLYRWTPRPDVEPPLKIFKSVILDYFTNQPSVETSMIPISDHLVGGYSTDFFDGKPLVFDFAKGMENAKGQVMSSKGASVLESTPMSLWSMALELHVGRCYAPFLGPISDLFVFFSGLLITLVLLSGYIISKRRKQKSKSRKRNKK